MSISESKPAFVQRFDGILSKMRWTHIGQAICWALLIATSGFALLAAIDYWYEVGLNSRAIGLGTLSVVTFAFAATWIVRAIRRWSRPKTAVEIEERFPELGQSVRTSVQYGGRSEEEVSAEGVATTLVTALADDTEQRVQPLGIDSIIPARRFWLAAATVVCAIGLFAGTIAMNWEWRVAASRALLGDQPYTELAVTPAASRVDEGQSLTVSLEVSGRTNRDVIMFTRPTDDDKGWTEKHLSADDVTSSEVRLVKYEVTLGNIDRPLEYRFEAGPAESQIHEVDVRYPLAIDEINIELTPPEYTGVETTTVNDGNLSVIDGTTATLQFKLDRAPAKASMLLTDFGRRMAPGEKPQTKTIPLKIDGATLSTKLELTEAKTYSIVAESSDGMVLPTNKFRIRVRKDEAPQIWFEEPSESLEVHSLAEVLLKIRARDDFGLAESGIVFEVNNEEEYTLLHRDYKEIAEQLAKDGGKITPQTRDALQQILPLEYFGMDQKDSVTYYAFAEDTFPGTAHRTETDLRFIDIRPFRRVYRVQDAGDGGGGDGDGDDGPEIRSLQEIITRQRFNLNRTIRLAKRPDDPSLSTVDRIGQFEEDLAKATRELAEFLDELEFDGSDLLFQSETAMLTSVDSLSIGKYEISSQQQKDALRLLIEGRNRIEIFLRDSANAAQRAALGNFDREQTQKLRRPEQENENEDEPERIVDQLRDLADREESIANTLAQQMMGDGEESEDGDQMPEGSDQNSDDEPNEMSREEIEEQQQEIVLDSQEIESMMQRIPEISELAQRRAEAATDMADKVSGALARGNTKEATEKARDTARMFRQLAINIEGLLANEASQKVAMARDLTGGVARLERRLAVETNPEKERREGAGTDQAKDEMSDKEAAGLGKESDELAEIGKTIVDILDSVVENNSPRDQEAIRQVDEILGAGELTETVKRMEGVSAMIADNRLEDASVEAADIGDQMEATSRDLDQIFRQIVTPRVERLNGLERRAAGLKEDLEELETNEAITRWHREARELLDDLDKANAANAGVDKLLEAMQKDGFSKRATKFDWNWEQNNSDLFDAPQSYHGAMSSIVEELQEHMQQVILTDLVSDDDEATPPKYKHLVDRYIQILSSDVREKK